MLRTKEQWKELITHTKCEWCGYEGLDKEPVQAYPHYGGWKIQEEFRKQWLFIVCPDCDYEWALWKLGVPFKT